MRQLIISVVLLLCVPAAQACPLPQLRVALHDFPPFYYIDAAGNATGQLVKLLNQAMGELGCSWSSEFMPANRLITSLANGTSDAAMLIKHPMLEGRAFYGEVPVGHLVLKLFRQPDLPAIGSLAELPPQARVIVRRGFGYNGYIDTLIKAGAGSRLVFADSHQEAVDMLNQREGDYLLNYQGPTQFYLDQKGYYHIDGDTLAFWPIYMVLSNRINHGDELVHELDRVFQRLHAAAQ